MSGVEVADVAAGDVAAHRVVVSTMNGVIAEGATLEMAAAAVVAALHGAGMLSAPDPDRVRREERFVATADRARLVTSLAESATAVAVAQAHLLTLLATERDVEARLADRLAEALRLTQEYVGDTLLPASPGWDWFDALALWGSHRP